MMKKAALLSFILLFAAFFALGCAKEAAGDIVVLDPSAAPNASDGVVLTPFSGEETAAPASSGKAAAEVVSSVAYAYAAGEQPTLYGAVEYKNTGTANVVITKAKFVFHAGDVKTEHEFEPVLAQYDVVAPGESSFITLWLPDGGISPDTKVTLEAELTCETAQNARANMEVSNLFLADNYPKFTTMSGTLKSASPIECSFLMTYVGFYDEGGKLLGVWYFTKNVRLNAGDSTDFVTRMEDMPVNGLSETAKTMKTSAFGFNYE